jgi:hypothetical protein
MFNQFSQPASSIHISLYFLPSLHIPVQ